MDHREEGGRENGSKATLSTKFHSLFNPSSPNLSTKWKCPINLTTFLKRKRTLDKDFVIKISKSIDVLNEIKSVLFGQDSILLRYFVIRKYGFKSHLSHIVGSWATYSPQFPYL